MHASHTLICGNCENGVDTRKEDYGDAKGRVRSDIVNDYYYSEFDFLEFKRMLRIVLTTNGYTFWEQHKRAYALDRDWETDIVDRYVALCDIADEIESIEARLKEKVS